MSLVISRLVGPMLRFAAVRGVPVDPEQFALGAEWARGNDDAIGNAALAALLQWIANALDEPHLGLVLPSALVFEGQRGREVAFAEGHSARELLRELTRSSELQEYVRFTLEENQLRAQFSPPLPGDPRGVSRHLNELALAFAMHHARARMETLLRAREVFFQHPRVPSLERLHTFFGTTRIHFGCPENALAFETSALDTPGSTVPTARGARAFEHRVTEKLREQLESGEVRLRKLARELRMSTRTLQRRLEDEGTSYVAVLDGFREERARALVREGKLPLTEIALGLGFSEFATFSRAFKRWTGVAPGAFRTGASR